MSREFIVNSQRLEELLFNKGWPPSKLVQEAGFSFTTIQRIKYQKPISFAVASRLSKVLCDGGYDERLFERVKEAESQKSTRNKKGESNRK